MPKVINLSITTEQHLRLKVLALMRYQTLRDAFEAILQARIESLTPNERAVFDSLVDIMEKQD